MNEPDLVTSHEAARLLNYTRQHVGRLLRIGQLAGIKVGRDLLVERQSLNQYISDRANLSLSLSGADVATPAAVRTEVPNELNGSPMRKSRRESVLAVDEIMNGREPTVEAKRLAKKIAWANGARPTETLHRVFLGDARDMHHIRDGEVQLVVTSPPYFNLIDYEGENAPAAQLGRFDSYGLFLDALDEVWRRCFDLLTPGGRVCVVVGDVCLSRRVAGRHSVLPLHADIASRCRAIGFDYLTPILWSKIANMATEVGGSARFLGKPYEPNAIIKNDVEYVLLLRKPGSYRKPTNAQRALSIIDPNDHQRWFRSIWSDIPGENRRAGHPAPYPIELAYRLISMFSFVGDTVLDPFWGTGTTSVAAIRAARSSIGIEIEPRYVEMGRTRLSQHDAAGVPARVEFPRA